MASTAQIAPSRALLRMISDYEAPAMKAVTM